LKTLEEPPPHVKFLLATTDPQKLPVTVLSRCLQFNLKRMPVGQISEHMKLLLEKEGVPFEVSGLRLVAQAADGSMRDGLSLLDQLIAFGGGKAGENEARAMLGTISRDHVERLAELLASMNVPELMKCASSLEEFAPDYAQVLDELSGLLVRVAMKQAVKDYEGDDSYAPELLERLAKALAPEDIQLFYQTAITGRRDLGLAPDPRTGFEMTLLRMIAFRPANDAGVAQGQISGAGASGARAAAVAVGGPGSGSGGSASSPGPQASVTAAAAARAAAGSGSGGAAGGGGSPARAAALAAARGGAPAAAPGGSRSTPTASGNAGGQRAGPGPGSGSGSGSGPGAGPGVSAGGQSASDATPASGSQRNGAVSGGVAQRTAPAPGYGDQRESAGADTSAGKGADTSTGTAHLASRPPVSEQALFRGQAGEGPLPTLRRNG
jgi:DNA polymerase-3 subunit gamma/tau